MPINYTHCFSDPPQSATTLQLKALFDTPLKGLCTDQEPDEHALTIGREAVASYLIRQPDPAHALLQIFEHSRTRGDTCERRFRQILESAPQDPSTPLQSYLGKAQTYARQKIREADQSASDDPAAGSSRLVAAHACLLAFGVGQEETHAQLRSLLRCFLARNLLAEASLMAVELYAQNIRFGSEESDDTLERCNGLFADIDGCAAGDRAAAMRAGVALDTYQFLLSDVPEPMKARLGATAKRLEDVFNQRVMACQRVSGQTDLEKLQKRAKLALKMVRDDGPVKNHEIARVHQAVEDRLSHLASENAQHSALTTTWLNRFVSLVTGYTYGSMESDRLLTDPMSPPCPLFRHWDNLDHRLDTATHQSGIKELTERIDRMICDNLIPRSVFSNKLELWAISSCYPRPRGHCILYIGPPGAGKSYMAGQTADILYPKSTVTTYNLTGSGKAVSPAGSSREYQDPQPGMITQALCNRGDGHTVIVIDEIDKGDAEAQQWLAAQLESSHFTDPYFGFNIFSHPLTFIGIANEWQNIQPHLQNRLQRKIIFPTIKKGDYAKFMERYFNKHLTQRHIDAKLVAFDKEIFKGIEANIEDLTCVNQSLNRLFNDLGNALVTILLRDGPNKEGTFTLKKLHLSEALQRPFITADTQSPPPFILNIPAAWKDLPWMRISIDTKAPAEQFTGIEKHYKECILKISDHRVSFIKHPICSDPEDPCAKRLILLNKRPSSDPALRQIVHNYPMGLQNHFTKANERLFSKNHKDVIEACFDAFVLSCRHTRSDGGS